MPADPSASFARLTDRSVLRASGFACATVVGMRMRGASAQTIDAVPVVPPSLSGSEMGQILQRLDPLAIGLLLVGVLILLLLVVRIAQMVRRDRPARPEARSVASEQARRRDARDRGDQPSLTARTDWGFDQNKRSSQTRATPLAGAAAPQTLSTQWSSSDVQNAAQASFQPLESMGKPMHRPPSPYRTSHNPYFAGEAAGDNTAMEVEEVADVLLQAELLVQLGDPKQAMTLLAQHIRDTEQPGPAVWLMLLNLYQTTGRKAQYDALARGFVTLFNAAVPPWATAGDAGARDLESYGQVLMRLQTGWPQPALRPFLEALLNDDRGGSRQGFSLTAYREILFLLETLDVLDRMTREDEERERIRLKLGTPG